MIIHGSDINEAAVRKVKSLADLKKLNIFSHLPNEDEANENLWNALHPGKPEPVKPVKIELPENGKNEEPD